MRLLVCGGRWYNDTAAVFTTLDDLNELIGISELCHGNAAGADFLANEWARYRVVPVYSYPANWASDGRAAGPIRNAKMLKEFKPDAVLAFPGGRGTEDMIQKAERAGVSVSRYTPEKNLVAPI